MQTARFQSRCASLNCVLGGQILPPDVIVRRTAGWMHRECVESWPPYPPTEATQVARAATQAVDPRIGRLIAEVARLKEKIKPAVAAGRRIEHAHDRLDDQTESIKQLRDMIEALGARVKHDDDRCEPGWEDYDEPEPDRQVEGSRRVLLSSLERIRKITNDKRITATKPDRIRSECDIIEAALHQITGD